MYFKLVYYIYLFVLLLYCMMILNSTKNGAGASMMDEYFCSASCMCKCEAS